MALTKYEWTDRTGATIRPVPARALVADALKQGGAFRMTATATHDPESRARFLYWAGVQTQHARRLRLAHSIRLP